MRRLLALASLAFVPGCAQSVWVKDGADPQDFARDSYQCERDVRQSGYYGTGLAGAINAQSFGQRCMAANGWHREVQDADPAMAASLSDVDRRMRAVDACEAAGVRPGNMGYPRCFQDHLAAAP